MIDTVPIARKLIGRATPNHKLETLIRYYNLATEEDHRGLSDSQHLMRVFQNMLKIDPEITTLDGLLKATREYTGFGVA